MTSNLNNGSRTVLKIIFYFFKNNEAKSVKKELDPSKNNPVFLKVMHKKNSASSLVKKGAGSVIDGLRMLKLLTPALLGVSELSSMWGKLAL